MDEFVFDYDTTEYSNVNAYWLGRAARLAYQPQGEIANTVKSWGLDNFRFFDGKKTDTQAFVAGNRRLIIVAFRGTEGKLEDWLTDIKIHKVDEVHRGFKAGLDEVWHEIAATIDTFIGQRMEVAEVAASPMNPEFPSVWYTGHSLGGALASLATAQMRRQGVPVDGLFTFGQPRTGSRRWAMEFDQECRHQTFRHVNNNDVVTRVPPRKFDYRHVGSLRYFDVDGMLHADIIWWNRFLDRVKGRLEDFAQLHTDGIKDHAMDKYLGCLKRRLPDS